MLFWCDDGPQAIYMGPVSDTATLFGDESVRVESRVWGGWVRWLSLSDPHHILVCPD